MLWIKICAPDIDCSYIDFTQLVKDIARCIECDDSDIKVLFVWAEPAGPFHRYGWQLSPTLSFWEVRVFYDGVLSDQKGSALADIIYNFLTQLQSHCYPRGEASQQQKLEMVISFIKVYPVISDIPARSGL